MHKTENKVIYKLFDCSKKHSHETEIKMAEKLGLLFQRETYDGKVAITINGKSTKAYREAYDNFTKELEVINNIYHTKMASVFSGFEIREIYKFGDD